MFRPAKIHLEVKIFVIGSRIFCHKQAAISSQTHRIHPQILSNRALKIVFSFTWTLVMTLETGGRLSLKSPGTWNKVASIVLAQVVCMLDIGFTIVLCGDITNLAFVIYWGLLLKIGRGFDSTIIWDMREGRQLTCVNGEVYILGVGCTPFKQVMFGRWPLKHCRVWNMILIGLY